MKSSAFVKVRCWEYIFFNSQLLNNNNDNDHNNNNIEKKEKSSLSIPCHAKNVCINEKAGNTPKKFPANLHWGCHQSYQMKASNIFVPFNGAVYCIAFYLCFIIPPLKQIPNCVPLIHSYNHAFAVGKFIVVVQDWSLIFAFKYLNRKPSKCLLCSK